MNFSSETEVSYEEFVEQERLNGSNKKKDDIPIYKRIRYLPLNKQIELLGDYFYRERNGYNATSNIFNFVGFMEAKKTFKKEHPEISLYKEYKKIKVKRQDFNVENTNSLNSFTFNSEYEYEY